MKKPKEVIKAEVIESIVLGNFTVTPHGVLKMREMTEDEAIERYSKFGVDVNRIINAWKRANDKK